VFVLTVVFGIFHGLLLLPVILSVAGPVHHDDHQESDSDTDSTNSDSYSPSPGFDNKAFTHNADLDTKPDKMEPSWTFSVLGFSKRGSWSPAANS